MLAVFAAAIALAFHTRAADDKRPAAPKPALTVNVTQPAMTNLPLRISANGNIAAW